MHIFSDKTFYLIALLKIFVYFGYSLEKDYATVVGEMAPRLVEKAKLQN